MLKRKAANTENVDEGSSSFILNKAYKLSEDLNDSELGEGELIDVVSMRGRKKEI
jgi:hypothetical protein